jgi:two-component system, cell cycle sensor histidine kinase and response regulator CckA
MTEMSNFNYTILVVDDEKSIRDLVAMILEGAGYHVLLAEHSDEALIQLEEYSKTVHLLLTDLKMDPYMDGCELAKCIRLLRPEISVLYISGFSENSMVQQEVAAGKAIFLAKPFLVSDFLEKVQTILEAIDHHA